MSTDRDLSNLLTRVNWEFPGSSARGRGPIQLFDARQVHWYPATFIPEIPYTLIQALTSPGDLVLDPFAGLGTTLWQAELLGRQGYALELNAVAVTVMQSIWNAIAAPSQSGILKTVGDAMSRSIGQSGEPPPESLRPWFSAGTWEELSEVRHAYDSLRDDAAAQGLLFLATSSLLRVLSEQRRGWGCVADNMKPRAADIANAPPREVVSKIVQRSGVISRQLATFADVLRSRGRELPNESWNRIVQGDARGIASVMPAETFQLVVTSPPYPGMMDYATSQRLSYYWLELDPEVALSEELGARRRRARRDSLERYTADIALALDATVALLKPGGYLCLILPMFAAKSADPREDALQAVLDGLKGKKLDVVWMGQRNLPTGRRQLNQGWATLESERIVIYRRGVGR